MTLSGLERSDMIELALGAGKLTAPNEGWLHLIEQNA